MSPRLTAMPPRLASPAPRIGPTQGDARAQDRERERVKPWRAWYRTARWSKLRRKILARAGHVYEQTGGPLLGRAPERACSDARQRCRRSASSHHVPRQASTCFRSVSIRIVLVNLYSQESKSEAAAGRIREKGLSGVKPIGQRSCRNSERTGSTALNRRQHGGNLAPQRTIDGQCGATWNHPAEDDPGTRDRR